MIRIRNLIGSGLVVALLLTALVLSVSAVAGPPALYKGSAQRLLPTASEVGYAAITSQAGGDRRASATYQTPGTPPKSLSIAVRVFKTEATAKASFEAACPGCQLRNSANGSITWKYKLRVQPTSDPRYSVVSVVARCRNLKVDTKMTSTARSSSQHGVAMPSRLLIDDIFVKARRVGMSPCQGTGVSPPMTGTHFWSEDYAEKVVRSKVRIPYCNAHPSDSGCRAMPALRVEVAQCRGLDEKRGTFTYSRFTCDILVGYYRDIRGRIAVWPTGGSTLRWEII
jgi:hypothetical protein